MVYLGIPNSISWYTTLFIPLYPCCAWPQIQPVNPNFPPQNSTKLTSLHYIGVTCLKQGEIQSLPFSSVCVPRGFLVFNLVCCLVCCLRQIELLRTLVAPSLSLFTLLSFTDCSSLSLLHFKCGYCFTSTASH
uniref:Uncharacterized protein n=1 Tax=Opuntia streptacantha TaxID=393608 RepID=A0A7C8YDE3_OPUST